MPTHSPTLRHHLIGIFAALLALAIALGACGVTFSGSLPGGTLDGTPGTATMIPGTTQCPGEPSSAGFGGQAYTPQDLRVAYGVQPLCEQGFTGKGQTVVVIVSYGSPTLQQDVDTFSRRFNLPSVTVDVRAPLGSKTFDPTDSEMTGWAEETSLDVEMIHSMAPEANIVVLTSPVDETEGVQGLPEFLQLEQYAVDNHLGTVINQSFGASEATLADSAAQQQIAQWNTFYQKATTQQGITFVAASGDGGATDYCDLNAKRLCTTRTVGFPADTPWVIAVGGTALNVSDTGTTESAWDGSEGGFSTFVAEPSYQQTLPAGLQSQLNNRRGIPDVSATGDPSTALAVYARGRWEPIGGTSASSPLWAGMMAVANQMAGHSLGFVNPALYQIGTAAKAAQDFRDVTSGDNSQPQAGVQGFSAVPGWDPVTGFGSPIADHLLPDLIAAAGTTTTL